MLSDVAVIASALKFWTYTSFHLFAGVPNWKVLSWSGTILLLTSALKVMLSVSASPNTISPSALIFPVACIFPVTFKLLCTLTLPVPFGLNSKFALLTVVLTVLFSNFKSSINATLL